LPKILGGGFDWPTREGGRPKVEMPQEGIMKSRRIGSIPVSEVGLGACLLSNEGRPGDAQAIATIHAALDAGVTLIDTADAYAISDADFGHNELLVRRALASYGSCASQVLVATKGGHTREGTAWGIDGDPNRLKRACRDSLRRLGVDAIGLYQLHWPDPYVPYAESVGALRDLLDEGLIQMAGISNADTSQIAVALDVLDGRLASVQNEFSVLRRASEAEVGYCAERGIAFLSYQPLGGIGVAQDLGAREPFLKHLAVDHGVSPQRVALAWLLARAPNVIPIPGARRPDTILDSAQAGTLGLTAAEIELLDLSRST
jgi:aryl-alcohol dehydrogenase-like predicted oxidoreductase